jgi:NaMN:DMB phosphoribosyltransferase
MVGLGFDAVPAADEACRAAAWRRLDSLTKPLGALGRLESLAAQVCAVLRTPEPAMTSAECREALQRGRQVIDP